MTYVELKRRYAEEALYEYAPVCFDSTFAGYNGVCIFREEGAFCVWFCDERGKPFCEHNRLSETDACEMVYSYAVNQKELELYREKKRSEEMPESPEHAVPGETDQFRLPLYAPKKEKEPVTETSFFFRAIKRVLDALSLEALLTIILVVTVIILVILCRLIRRLSVSPLVTGLILLGIVLAFFFEFRSYLRKKANSRKRGAS